jgi:hypothetical protein
MTKSAWWILMIVAMLVLLSLDCRKGNPITSPDNSFALTVDDASCAEVYLNLKIGAGITSRTITLMRDTITLFTKTIDATETALTDTNLLPGHTYSYTASLSGGMTALTQAKTMDTTSSAISWTSYQLGDGSSSVLYDVAIVGDSAWVVGEIHQGGFVYSLAKWNGSKWQLYQLYFNGDNLIVPINGILVLGNNDVWLAAGGVFHWDGVSSHAQLNFSRLTLPDPNATVDKLWGISSSSIYGVGKSGTIVHYNGSSWTKIESGTPLDIQNVHGAWNRGTNAWEILTVASTPFIGMDKEVLRIGTNNLDNLPLNGIAEPVSDIWLLPNRFYIAVGSGMYTKHSLNDSHWDTVSLDFDSYYKYAAAGNDRNDLIAVGGYGEVVHFNGIRWKSYYSETQISGNYYAVAMKGNLIIAVGGTSTVAEIAIGRRTN